MHTQSNKIKRRIGEKMATGSDAGEMKCLICEDFTFINITLVSRITNSGSAEEMNTCRMVRGFHM